MKERHPDKDKWPFSFQIPVPSSVVEANLLVYGLITVNPQNNFQGGLLWILDWTVGDSNQVQAGIAILQQMRRGHSQHKPLREASGHLFCDDEWLQLYAFLLIPFWYGWDALFIEKYGEIIQVSHHQTVTVHFKERFWYENAKNEMIGWDPKITGLN